METEVESHAGEKFEDIRGGAIQEDYSQAHMHKALLFGTFTQCIFRYTDMFGVDMSGCQFENCTFLFCDMTDSNWERATFSECEFIGCHLREIDASDARFTKSVMHACTAIDANFKDSVWEEGAISGNFMGSKWEGCILTEIAHENVLLLGSDGFPA